MSDIAAQPGDVADEPAKKPVNRLLVVGVLISAVLEILDITIVNVSLPHMMGNFAATSDQITWVLSSYLVSQAIFMPLTGYLSRRLGRGVLLNTAVIGFLITSVLCGLSWNLESLVVFRLAQGAFGATLIPLSQSIILDAFPREQAPRAMAIFGLGIVVAPVFGPMLGGWLTDNLGWRTIFLINLPLGIISLLLVYGQLKGEPDKNVKTDWFGMLLLATAIGALQLMVDQGESKDWFESKLIQILAFTSFSATLIFLVRGWGKADNIVDLGLFKDRNFAVACIMIFIFGIGMFGTIALLPLFTQRLMGYSPFEAGMLFMPRALASAFTMIFVGAYLQKKVDPRYIIATGLIFATIGPFIMTNYSLDVDKFWLIFPGMLIGIGTGMFFVPLSTIAFDQIPPDKQDEASGLFSLMRSLGASIGVAIISYLFVEQAQVKWMRLGENISPFSYEAQSWFAQRGLDMNTPEGTTAIAGEIARQAQMLAFIDLFWLIGWITLVILPFGYLMTKPTKTSMVPGH